MWNGPIISGGQYQVTRVLVRLWGFYILQQHILFIFYFLIPSIKMHKFQLVHMGGQTMWCAEAATWAVTCPTWSAVHAEVVMTDVPNTGVPNWIGLSPLPLVNTLWFSFAQAPFTFYASWRPFTVASLNCFRRPVRGAFYFTDFFLFLFFLICFNFVSLVRAGFKSEVSAGNLSPG